MRFWFGQTFELSGHEAYLWLQGHGTNLSPAYWERGPLVPLLIRIGTSFFGDTELGVRWPAAVICCSTGFILFYLARHWFNARTAFWTVVLFIVIPVYAWKFSFMTEAAASVGLMAVAMVRAFTLAIEKDRGWWWLLGGAACGLALLVALPNAWWIVGLLIYFAIDPERTDARLREGCPLGNNPLHRPVPAAAHLVVAGAAGGRRCAHPHAQCLAAGAWLLAEPGVSSYRPGDFLSLPALLCSPCRCCPLGSLGRQLGSDPRYSFLVCLAVPGLIWQNFAAFFHEGRFELVRLAFPAADSNPHVELPHGATLDLRPHGCAWHFARSF